MFYVYWAELVEHGEGTGYIPTGEKSGQNLNIKIRSKAMPDSFQVGIPLFHLFDDPSNTPPHCCSGHRSMHLAWKTCVQSKTLQMSTPTWKACRTIDSGHLISRSNSRKVTVVHVTVVLSVYQPVSYSLMYFTCVESTKRST